MFDMNVKSGDKEHMTPGRTGAGGETTAMRTNFQPRRRDILLGGSAALMPLLLRRTAAQPAAPVRIGVLGDFSGPYSGISGAGSVTAARLAIADFGGSVLGRPIEIVTGDHLNKPDLGLSIVREWFGPGNVSMITDVANTAIALGIQPLLTETHRIALYTTVGSSELIGKACSPLSVLWGQDTWANTVAPIRALLKQGKTSYFLIAADYAFGKVLENDATTAIQAGGGKVLGVARHPLHASDFSSLLLSAQSSGADVVMLLNGGGDFTNSFKQAVEFRLTQKQAVVGPIVFLSDIHSLGLETAKGLQFMQSWYWDQNDATRAWAKRYFAEQKTMPNDTHASGYSAVLQYLRAVQRAKTDDAEAVMAALRATTISDMFTPDGHIRTDGKMVFDRFLVKVKAPAESKGEWDCLGIASTVPAAEGFRPLSESECRLVRA
jgi:branched-chain amino acid transport system substrate-binding protein